MPVGVLEQDGLREGRPVVDARAAIAVAAGPDLEVERAVHLVLLGAVDAGEVAGAPAAAAAGRAGGDALPARAGHGGKLGWAGLGWAGMNSVGPLGDCGIVSPKRPQVKIYSEYDALDLSQDTSYMVCIHTFSSMVCYVLEYDLVIYTR